MPPIHITFLEFKILANYKVAEFYLDFPVESCYALIFPPFKNNA